MAEVVSARAVELQAAVAADAATVESVRAVELQAAVATPAAPAQLVRSIELQVAIALPAVPEVAGVGGVSVTAASAGATVRSPAVLLSAASPFTEDEAPAPTGLAVSVWDGAAEVAATLTVWDGAAEVAAYVDEVHGG